ncbi:hypothetical protein MASR2M29_19000 [Spirochaetota bacterium]
MNLTFLKLRVANSPWLLFEAKPEMAEAKAAFWPQVAGLVCPASMGAAAEGIITLDRSSSPVLLDSWNARGQKIIPGPSAMLAAARLLFDEGKANSDSVSFLIDGREMEVIVIDSATFGIPVGYPSGPMDMSGVRQAGFKLTVLPENGVSAFIELWGSSMNIVLYEQPPKKNAHAYNGALKKHQAGRVEAMVITRQILKMRAGRVDPLVAGAGALSLGIAGDFTDREIEVKLGLDSLAVQWPRGGPIVAAASPEYCFSAEVWVDSEPERQ